MSSENGGTGVPDIPELVDGVCPVCGGTEPLDEGDLDG